MRLFFGQIKNILLLQREHVCQLLFRSMSVDNERGQWNNPELFKNTILYKNNAISHYVVSISNKRVDAQTKEV